MVQNKFTKIFIRGKWYNIKSKKELLSDFFQEILKKGYFIKKRTMDNDKEFIKCNCNVRLYTAKSGDFLILRTYPRQSEYHRAECVFSKLNIDEYFDYESRSSIKIKSDKVIKKHNNTKESRLFISTFNHLLLLVIENAYCSVFNKVNMGINRKEYNLLRQPKADDITQFIKNDLLSLEIENTTVKNLLEKLGYELFINIAKIVTTDQKIIFETTKKNRFSVDKNIVYWVANNLPIKVDIKEESWYLVLIIREKSTKRYIRFYIEQVSYKNDTVCFVEGTKEEQLVNNSKYVWFKNLLPTSFSKVLTKEYLYQYFQAYENETSESTPSLIKFGEKIEFYDNYGNILISI